MFENLYKKQRHFFDNGNTLNYDFRISQLKKLKFAIEKSEDDIIDALNADLGKPEFESYTAEIGIIYQELNYAMKNLKTWMKARKVSTPIFLKPSKSYIYPQPKGIVLIISPWNYPFQLAISPLIGAIAAGNCIVLKPSNKSINTEKVISKIIKETFKEDYINIVQGPGSKVVNSLIENYRFDHIFFTGSVNVGKIIMNLASKHLTPVTLELGGKSPAIVHKDTNINMAAKKITWAKFYNAGQTCVAPDYLLIHESIKDKFVEKSKKYINEYYGETRKNNFSRIINEDRFNRLITLLREGNILEGGNYNKEDRFISPTMVDNISLKDKIMKEEIFGPILPILTYSSVSDVIEIIRENPYPLALYLFTEDKSLETYIINNIQFGGGCVNDAISHLINPNLPFGGFGFSGMGRYHSKYTFDTFTHEKSILKSKNNFEFNLKYPPYNHKKLNLAKRFLK